MQITLNYTSLYDTVARSLSIIGQRSVDDNGNLLFKDITLGSREKDIIYDYFRSAINGLAADLRQYVTAVTSSSTSFTLTVSLYDDANSNLSSTVVQAVKDYVTAYALYSWFTITAPRISEKYKEDAMNQRNFVIAQTFHRQRPQELPNPLRQKTEN